MEEWIDCTKQFFPLAKLCFYDPNDGYFIPVVVDNNGRIYVMPVIDMGHERTGIRVRHLNESSFIVERRVEKKYCPVCGQEVKK